MTNNDKERAKFISNLDIITELQELKRFLIEIREDLDLKEVNSKKLVKNKIDKRLGKWENSQVVHKEMN